MTHLIRDDGARLEYEVRQGSGAGRGAFVFQHGMGGDRNQPLGYVRSPIPLDLVSMDARAHGGSSDIIGTARAGFDAYGDDIAALVSELGGDPVVLGGISLGAGIALNTAIRHPEAVSALVLCRPAWLETAQAPRNVEAYARIAGLLDKCEVDAALREFTDSPLHQEVLAESPNAAQSLRGQITRPRAAVNAEMLRIFPAQSPAPDLTAWSLTVPTLVLGHHDDPFHPWKIAEETANRIPGSRLVEVPSKDRDLEGFAEQTDQAIKQFLDEFASS
jgi:pimeloyl-ACP methyl ester carboxylesterase